MRANKLVFAVTLLCVWFRCDAKSFDAISKWQGFDQQQDLVFGAQGSQVVEPGETASNNSDTKTTTMNFENTKALTRQNTAPVSECDTYTYLRPFCQAVIQSDNYPGNYFNFTFQLWTFETDEGSTLDVTCGPIELEEIFDHLYFFLPASVSYDGVVETGVQLTTTGNKLIVLFQTDFSIVFSGFSCTVSVYGATGDECPIDCGCGISDATEGSGALATKYPWQVAIFKLRGQNFHFKCAGVILSDVWIMTAAHCVEQSDHHFVRVGDADSEAFFSVEQKIIHENYDNHFEGYDIALLKMGISLDLSDNGLAPVCLPADTNHTYEGENAAVISWARTKIDQGKFASTLQEVDVVIRTNEACQKNKNEDIPDIFFCAETYDNVLCNKDDEGVLIYNNSGIYEVIGIMSTDQNNCGQNSATLYTRVPSFFNWIQDNAEGICV
ncbi:chymotrypsin-like protease CTRL-1 isoform X2 [Homarus americanus]|uniref:chymotrypsin-like protease CTRL-1 isoform X2 n=1 Tax=Homarus americanus TaxID=6706 RepID=UPI001C46A10D|nr:chymotrypsin-like protease CTRL-1 isoform X2 [Homarus americanus]